MIFGGCRWEGCVHRGSNQTLKAGKGVRSKEEEERVWGWPSQRCEEDTESALV